MSANSSIEWTDRTWNPVTGCTKVSPGCDHCYAKAMHERFHGPGSFDTVALHPDRLAQPLRWRKPSKVFVNSMSDLFHDAVPDEYIAEVFSIMGAAPLHTFQILTKRHARMRALLKRWTTGESTWRRPDGILDVNYMPLDADPEAAWARQQSWPLPNVWLGVSVETQQWADVRIPALLDTPAAVRFLSCEPMLGPVDLGYFSRAPLGDAGVGDLLIDWVICGGESGPGARPMHPDWARSLRDQCVAAGVPFFMKQAGTVLARAWGIPGKGANPAEWPEAFPQEYPHV